MARDVPSRTVTFLFTDVEGSTRLLHELGAERYAEALAEHRRVIRKACSSAGGVEVDTQGDAFFSAFPTAPGALAAAEEMTKAGNDEALALIRAQLNDAAFLEAWEQGRKQTADEAVALALTVLASSGGSGPP